jgi:hypothetical protein
MEFLIGLLIFGAVIYLLPYILAGILLLSSIAAAIILGFFALLKGIFGRKA